MDESIENKGSGDRYRGIPDIHGLLSKEPIDPRNFLVDSPFLAPIDGETVGNLFNVQGKTRTAFGGQREYIILSPFIPRGFTSWLTATSPLKISHATGSNLDVASDPTQCLALYVAREKGYRGDRRSFSCGALLRCVRLQNYPKESGYLNHFEMYGTLDTGTNNPQSSFRIEQIVKLVDTYTHLIEELIPDNPHLEISIGHTGIATRILEEHNRRNTTKEERSEIVSTTIEGLGIGTGRLGSSTVDFAGIQRKMQEQGYDITKALRQLEVLAGILNTHGYNTTIHIDRINGLGHYNGCMFSIHMPDGVDIIDGGAVDWVQKLTQDAKIQTVVSGFGTEFFTRQYLNYHV